MVETTVSTVRHTVMAIKAMDTKAMDTKAMGTTVMDIMDTHLWTRNSLKNTRSKSMS